MRAVRGAAALAALLAAAACANTGADDDPMAQGRRDAAPIVAGLSLLKKEVELEAIAAAGVTPLGGLAFPDLGETAEGARFEAATPEAVTLAVDGQRVRLGAPSGGEFPSGLFIAAGAPGAPLAAWPGQGSLRVLIARAGRHDFAREDPTAARLAERFGAGDGKVLIEFLEGPDLLLGERAVVEDRAEIAFESGPEERRARGWIALRPLGGGLVALAIAEDGLERTTSRTAREWVAAAVAAAARIGPDAAAAE